MNVDVIVMGSGPAGCAAAISCKQRGLQVLLIAGKSKKYLPEDKEDQPSESIHPGILPVLAQLNAGHCVQESTKAKYEGICVNNQLSPLGEDEYGSWQGYHINREIFDSAFLQSAKKQGVFVIEDDTVKNINGNNERVTGVTTDSGAVFTCPYLIDATGYKRTAGKQLQFKENFHSPPLIVWTGITKNIPLSNSIFENNFARFIPHSNGWTWLAPEPPDRCTWTRMELKGKQQFLPPVELQPYYQNVEIKKANRRWRVFRPVCKEGLLLCGDAAGIIDPAAGQGILNAILSAMMTATTIQKCISNPDFEAMYLAQYDDWFINNYLDKVQRLKQFYTQHGISIF